MILNASVDQITGGVDSLKEGEKIEFKLVEMAVMTMSIPPQVPGNSIIEITVNKKNQSKSFDYLLKKTGIFSQFFFYGT